MDKKIARQNFIFSIASAVILWGIVAVIFDFYYDLNDDILIKDIISGIYTGTANAHNNQMMYPISLLFVGLYKISNSIPWFGLVEIGLFALAFVIILNGFLSKLNRIWQKIVVSALFSILFATVYIWEIVMLQYTVVSGMLCASATIIVFCHESDSQKESATDYLKAVWPAALLLVIAFNIRSEMFLLMCPFMAAAGIARWLKEPGKTDLNDGSYKGIFDISNIKKYFSFIGIILAFILMTTALDSVAYSSPEWKQFREFFDARTELYDFTGIPDYEANKDFYENNSISYEQYTLLVNYNFAIDKTIDAKMLKSIVSFAKSGNALNGDGTIYSKTNRSLKTAIGEYIRNVTNISVTKEYDSESPFSEEKGQYSPYSILIMLLYVALFVAAFYGKNRLLYLTFAVIALFRSIAWIYVFYMGRIVPRITHPMYMIEIVLLVAIILDQLKIAATKIKRDGKTGSSGPEVIVAFGYITAVLMLMICCGTVFSKWSEVSTKSKLRDQLNEQVVNLNEYIAGENKYYYLDVYSTVDWTEKVFTPQVSKRNQQLAGGWIAFSPLDSEKRNGYPNNFYFVTLENRDELDWFNDWCYSSTGFRESEFDLIDTLDGKKGTLNIFDIYQVTVD